MILGKKRVCDAQVVLRVPLREDRVLRISDLLVCLGQSTQVIYRRNRKTQLHLEMCNASGNFASCVLQSIRPMELPLSHILTYQIMSASGVLDREWLKHQLAGLVVTRRVIPRTIHHEARTGRVS